MFDSEKLPSLRLKYISKSGITWLSATYMA